MEWLLELHFTCTSVKTKEWLSPKLLTFNTRKHTYTASTFLDYFWSLQHDLQENYSWVCYYLLVTKKVLRQIAMIELCDDRELLLQGILPEPLNKLRNVVANSITALDLWHCRKLEVH